jgi:hypothetical protein
VYSVHVQVEIEIEEELLVVYYWHAVLCTVRVRTLNRSKPAVTGLLAECY